LTASGAERFDHRVLRVCADPNNLPFSNQKGEGFENSLAELIARDLNARVEYAWFPQRRGFIRNTLGAGICDIVMGVPRGFDPVETTRPYYRSTYVFITRKDRKLRIYSLDNPALRRLSIGLHVIGDDYSNPPPMHALARRNIVRNVQGYSIYGDYSQPNPPARLIEAVAEGKIDVAIAWGPLGGYFAKHRREPLEITAIIRDQDGPDLPFAFNISMGVRKGDKALREELDRIIAHRAREITKILSDFGVPLKTLPSMPAAHAKRQ
jgi:quinoprotein dehydrogenase-associated probable ABC transporter substrate-binding protein